MMQKEYKAVFDYYGFDEHSLLFGEDIIKSLAKVEFVVAYNKFCRLVNPMFLKWNAEFDDLYPDWKWDGDDGEETKLYNEWIRVKQQELIDKYINPSARYMHYIIDPDIEYQFVGQLAMCPDCKICFHLEER